MSPCKNCIVRPGCSLDCKEFKKYKKTSSILAATISIILAGICITILFNFLDSFLMKSEIKELVYALIWFPCIVFNIITNVKSDEKLNELTLILFAPFVTLALILIFAFSYHFKNKVRKRE